MYFLGSNQLMLILWVLGGILAVCGALTLCELTALIPRSGGDYVYLHESYGPAVAFLSGWVSFFIGFGGPIAATSSAAANYLLVPFALLPATEALVRPSLASAIVLALAWIITAAVAESSIRTQGVDDGGQARHPAESGARRVSRSGGDGGRPSRTARRSREARS